MTQAGKRHLRLANRPFAATAGIISRTFWKASGRFFSGEALSYEHWNQARKVCVVGAGTMGSGIAAHLANIGFEVTLLDLTRDAVESAFARAKALKPPHLYVPDTAQRIRLGSIQDDLQWVADADWICEAIVEKLELKQALFAQMEPLLPESAMISTNTSGLQIGLLAEGRSESFKRRFLGTHFFNPPRYLKLLELIPTDETDPAATASFAKFLEERCARRVVVAKDTPGFIANRFGMWAMYHAVHTAERLGLTIEQVDAISGPFLGRPKTGAFRLNDLVGLDIMQDIANNLITRCPHDPHMDVLNTPRSMATLVERGHIGAKSGMGYYKREGKELLAFDLGTMAYRQMVEVAIPSLREFGKAPLTERLRAAVDARDEAGEFVREHLLPVLRYADYLKEEISHSVLDFDRVMKWGFGWEQGPFEMIDSIGSARVGLERSSFYFDGSMRNFDGSSSPLPVEPDYRNVHDFPILEQLPGLNVRDLGDGVVALAFTTKMGSITTELVQSMHQLLDAGKYERFVVTSEAKTYSVGFDLKFFQAKITTLDWAGIDAALIELQNLVVRLGRYPTVAAVFGYGLGAGAEIALGCAGICAAAEANIGLPESKVGLLPGGGGTAIMAARAQARGAKHMSDVCMAISTGFVSSSADDARRIGLLQPSDQTVYHPDRLIDEAKKMALAIVPSSEIEWVMPQGPISGMVDRAQSELKNKGEFTNHDEVVADQIKHVFAKPSTFEGALAEERIGFLHLCKNGLTAARIAHMLEHGKPLKN